MIGSQCWMSENLAYLPTAYAPTSGSNSFPYYYVYDYHGALVSEAKATTSYQVYGVLYNWTAAMDSAASSYSVPSGVKGVCPYGWHLPSDEEWMILEGAVDSLYGYPDPEWDKTGLRGYNAGGNLKENDTLHWNPPNSGATNIISFTALPGGVRGYSRNFSGLNEVASFWTTSKTNGKWVRHRNLNMNFSEIYRMTQEKQNGLSVRCIKD